MATATYISAISDFEGDARLYKLNPRVRYTRYNHEGVKETHESTYVVVSAIPGIAIKGIVVNPMPETYIFPADNTGHITSWTELKGSFKGSMNHQQAINNMGYTLV